MPKDERRIAGSVRVAGKGVFTQGQEDELEAALSPAEVKSLTERKVISGFGAKRLLGEGKPKKEEKAEEKEVAEKAKK